LPFCNNTNFNNSGYVEIDVGSLFMIRQIEEGDTKGYLNELNFGYTAKMEGYTNSSSDIPKLYKIPQVRGEENG
jgi:hypothetical protein